MNTRTNLLRQLQLTLLPLALWAGPARATDVYECTVVEAQYLTDQGYKPHYGETEAYVSHHITIDKISGAALGPMYPSELNWKRISTPSDYTYFETIGYASNGRPIFDLIVKDYLYNNKQLNLEPLAFISIDRLTLNILDGPCK